MSTTTASTPDEGAPQGRRVVRRSWLAALDPALSAIDARYHIGPWSPKDCPDCHVPARGPREYCDAHRCHALTVTGRRCRSLASPERAFQYCSEHGCDALLQGRAGRIPAVVCMLPRDASQDAPRCHLHPLIVDSSGALLPTYQTVAPGAVRPADSGRESDVSP